VADAAAVLINITLATATLAAGAALADVNRVGRRAPREQRLYHVCVWPTAAACSRERTKVTKVRAPLHRNDTRQKTTNGGGEAGDSTLNI
jgi:hypothetical protein